ncbi:hypothetical protein [Nibribacter koreensis]|uniref:Uncharacterized protein n=1 Tax=Nibribacter koreensis TaxID=1084519 RepID=A0ABP8FR99_9BACT
MEFHPPINERETDDLIEIANSPGIWQPDAIDQAKWELLRRGISKEAQQQKIAKWDLEYHLAIESEFQKRALEGYNPIVMIMMIIKLPNTILWDWYLKRDGYFRKHKQRLWIIATGLFCYASFFAYFSISKPVEDEAWLKKFRKKTSLNGRKATTVRCGIVLK